MFDRVNAMTTTVATHFRGRFIPSLAFLLIFAFVRTPGATAQSVTEDRPVQELFLTELVYTQDRGEIQLATGMRTQWNHDLLQQWPVQAEYGITDRLQLQVEWAGWERLRPMGLPAATGPGDVSVGAKYSFMNIRGSAFRGALSFEAGLPLGSEKKGLGEGVMSYTPSFLFARDLSQRHRLQLFTQIGVSFVQRVSRDKVLADNTPAAHELEWNSGVFVPLRHVVVVAEVAWQTNKWNQNGQKEEWLPFLLSDTR